MTPGKKQLRYLGTADRFEDGETGLTFEAGGEPHGVSEEDAERLVNQPGELWEIAGEKEKQEAAQKDRESRKAKVEAVTS